MAFPILGTPKPAFFDSSGAPLSGGTLTIVEPSTDVQKATYPTYDDAEAATNPNDNPLTLDARGECDLWGLDNEDYKVTVKDSNGATIWTTDDIFMPTASRYYAVTSAETTAGVTPTNYEYEPGDVRRYGADGSGDETTAFNNAVLAMSNGGVVDIPLNTFTVTTLDINKNVEVRGLGRAETIVTVTSEATDSETSSKYSVRLLGNDDDDGLLAVPKLTGMKIDCTTATASVHGLLVRRKSIVTDVWVDSATGDGIYFDTDAANNATFFSRFTDVWSKNNTGYGCNLREGANANVFINCQFDSNGSDGFIMQTDGIATNGNVVIGGQASFNDGRGYNLDSGTNFTLHGTYAEFNGAGLTKPAWATSTAYTAGDLVTSPSSGLTDAQTTVVYQAASNHTSDGSSFETDYDAGLWEPYGEECRVSNSVTYSNINFGVVLSNKTHRIRNESSQITTKVMLGGYYIAQKDNTPQLVQSLRFRDGADFGQNSGSLDVTFQVGSGGEMRQIFQEATTNTFANVFDGTNSAPTNQFIIRCLDITGSGGGEFDYITCQQNSRMGFFGATPVVQQTGVAVTAAGIHAALVNLGLITA